MYKSIKLGKVGIAFERFSVKAREVSDVYYSGFHKWDSMYFKAYSIVLGAYRIIITIDKNIGAYSNG